MSIICNVPFDKNGESALEYSWFVTDGLGFSLHVFDWRICLFAIDGYLVSMEYLLSGKVVEIRDALEIDITLFEYRRNVV